MEMFQTWQLCDCNIMMRCCCSDRCRCCCLEKRLEWWWFASIDHHQKNDEHRKKELLQAIPPRGDKWAWHQEMSKLNAELSKLAATRSQATRQELENLSSELRQSQALHSREASFCLYPRQEIMPQLKRLAEGE